ncbi:DnaJ -like protein subfamily C member 21, partial [Caligus rogercresseyi]
ELEDEIQNIESMYSSDEDEEALYCRVCDVDFSNKRQRKNHFKSQSHQKQVEVSYSTSSVPEAQEEEEVESEACSVCDKTLKASESMEKHLKSKGHRDNVSRLHSATKGSLKPQGKSKKRRGASKEAQDDPLNCATCQEVFPSRNKLFGHIKETNHALRL